MSEEDIKGTWTSGDGAGTFHLHGGGASVGLARGTILKAHVVVTNLAISLSVRIANTWSLVSFSANTACTVAEVKKSFLEANPLTPRTGNVLRVPFISNL